MKLLSESSYARLDDYRTRVGQAGLDRDKAEQELTELKVRHEKVCAAHRALERRYQELVLACGLKGIAVEEKPPVPAQPARIVIRIKHGK